MTCMIVMKLNRDTRLWMPTELVRLPLPPAMEDERTASAGYVAGFVAAHNNATDDDTRGVGVFEGKVMLSAADMNSMKGESILALAEFVRDHQGGGS